MLEVKFGEALLEKTQTTAVRYAYLSVGEQLAARLLEVSHLLRSDSIPLTQEELGEMLAIRRSSVTDSAIELKRARLIAYSRGNITIRDRAGLRKLTLATDASNSPAPPRRIAAGAGLGLRLFRSRRTHGRTARYSHSAESPKL